MLVYLLCARRNDAPRWTLEGVVTDRGEAEQRYHSLATRKPAALSVMEVETDSDYFTAAYKVGGFDADDSVTLPPGDVLLRNDG